MFWPSFLLFRKATLFKAAGPGVKESCVSPSARGVCTAQSSRPTPSASNTLGPRNKVMTIKSQYLYFVLLKFLIPSLSLFLFIREI